ncbi:hypothetical protein CXG81DRAFT_2286, partial [Caulochytrium protostelioides]
PRVVASLSSFPGRLDVAYDTVKSLAESTVPFDKIYIHIPRSIKRLNITGPLPAVVDRMLATWPGLVEITRPEDYGPSTKVLGALLVEKDPSTVILSFDDDVVYQPDVAAHLIRAMEGLRNYVPCFICEHWPKWFYKPLYQLSPGECRGWMNGYAGMAYRVGYFGKDVFDYSHVPEGCKLHDDVYLAGYLRARGIRPYVIDTNYKSLKYHGSHTSMSINKVPDTEDKRDPCAKHFNYL